MSRLTLKATMYTHTCTLAHIHANTPLHAEKHTIRASECACGYQRVAQEALVLHHAYLASKHLPNFGMLPHITINIFQVPDQKDEETGSNPAGPED